MLVKKIEIAWHPGLPVFASESFLRAVGDDYGWLGGFDDTGKLRCILPYTIVQKAILRMVRFRVSTITVEEALSIEEERAFLISVLDYLHCIGADMVIPASTNAIFRTFPDGADAAPYGTYVIDLSEPQDVLWKQIDRITRQNINTARKKGVSVRIETGDLAPMYNLVRDTFSRSKLPFMSSPAFERYVKGLGDYGKIMIADYQGVAQSYVLFAFSDYCAYAVYAGNLANQFQGANKLLYWEAISMFKSLGVQRYDFVGARIDPEKGSKEWAINSLKKHFGAKLQQGYLWKISLNPLKYRLYCIAARLRSGGDIVDAERHKMRSTTDRPPSGVSDTQKNCHEQSDDSPVVS